MPGSPVIGIGTPSTPIPSGWTIVLKMNSRKSNKTSKETTYQEVYRIHTADDITITRADIYSMLDTSFGIKIGYSLPEHTAAKIINMSIENNEKDIYWEVTCDYSTAFKLGGTTSDPLTQSPVYNWGEKFNAVEAFFDTSGDPILNAAGDAFEKYPEVDLAVVTCEMIRNENSSDFNTHFGNWFNAFGAASSDFWLFRPMVNSASFTLNSLTIPAKWAKLTVGFEVKPYSGGGNYYEVHYYFEIKRGGWEWIAPQYGFYELGSGGEKLEILDANGKPVKKPWPLDSLGAKMPNADDAPDNLTYVIFPEFAFSSFSFT
jgi:hypothetical protein